MDRSVSTLLCPAVHTGRWDFLPKLGAGMNSWFRMYHEVPDDPKVQRLPPLLFKAWINLMCVASRNSSRRGTLPDIDDVAYALRVSNGRAQSYINDLVQAGFFELKGGIVYVHNWHGRQPRSDDSNERVKRWRNGNGNVTADRNVKQVDVTLHKRREEEREEKSPPPPVGAVLIYSPDFELFWTAYPRKTGKGAAWNLWRKLKPSIALQDQIIQSVGLARQSHDWKRDNGRYIPNPSTWLNQRRWEDSVKTETAPAGLHDFL